MAGERWRDERYRDTDRDRWRESSGRSREDYRGGARSYGPSGSRDYGEPIGASRGYGRPRDDDDRGEFRGRERDYGDSAGYGSGGSARDWRDVVGDDRDDRHRGREPGAMDLAFGQGFGSGYEGRDYGGERSRRPGRGRDEGRRSGARDERGFLERAGDEIASWFGDDDAERRRWRDTDERGHHRGRGPKGYQRSDERIRDDVNDRLTDDPHIDASEIEVSVSGREVTLSGTVNSRFEKRHADDIAESVSGVTHVQNNLRVQQSAGISGGMGSGSSMGGARGTTGGSTASTGSAGGLSGANAAGSSATSGRRRSSTTS